MSFDTITAALGITLNGSLVKSAVTNGVASYTVPLSNGDTLTFTKAGNGVALGADSVVVTINSISASGNLSVDLSSLTDPVGTAVNLARLKAALFWLIPSADGGTACTSVTIDNTVSNALSDQGNTGWFDNANEGTATGGAGDATGSKFTIPNGGLFGFGTPSAAGIPVDGTHKIVKFHNNDAGVAASLLTVFIGGTS